MLSLPCRRPRAASGLCLRGRPLPQFLACHWTPGRQPPRPKGKTPRRVERCPYKAGTTPPLPAGAAHSGAKQTAFLLECAAEPGW